MSASLTNCKFVNGRGHILLIVVVSCFLVDLCLVDGCSVSECFRIELKGKLESGSISRQNQGYLIVIKEPETCFRQLG